MKTFAQLYLEATTPTWTPTQQKAIQAVLKRIKNGVIKGSVDLDDLQLKKLPDLSKVKVEGSFYCSQNQLQTLEGSPQFVGGSFLCSNNLLRTLDGGPQFVGGMYSCMNNPGNFPESSSGILDFKAYKNQKAIEDKYGQDLEDI